MKTMRNLFILTLLVAVTLAGTVRVDADSASTAGPGNPLDVGESPISRMVIPSTQTITVGTNTATLIGTIPSACHSVWLCSASGSFNIGNASCTIGGGWINVASGSYLKLNLTKEDATPAIYISNFTDTVSATVRLIYGR